MVTIYPLLHLQYDDLDDIHTKTQEAEQDSLASSHINPSSKRKSLLRNKLCVGGAPLDASCLDNLAYKKPTWQTLDKYSSDKAVDGLYTNLSAIGNQCAVSFASSEVTWLVDLETINSISKIVLYHVTEGSTLGCPLGFYGGDCLKTCPVNCHHCNYESGKCLGGCRRGFFGHFCNSYERSCPIVQSRFQNEACRLMCLEMCRKDLENLSYKKRTWQSATYSSSGTSDKAVDGRHTSRHYSRINNGYTAVFLGFSLYVSNSTNRLDGILCHHDTNYTRETSPDHVSIDCPYHGQYVIFYNERLPGVTYPSGYSNMAYGDLCEVEVYGCPVVEVPQCSKPCPSNCEECYPDTGICMKCKLGFEGYACERGRFGINIHISISACQAVTDVKVSLPVTIAGSAYEALFSSKGLSFPEHGYHNMSLFLSLSEQSTNLVNVSFTIHGASVVSVYLLDEIGSLISMVSIHNI
uniref:Uncharacterized protein n=1 Tax=Magallana gigas TaxID=29159 RepID=K1QDV4_MAGGI